MTFIVTDENILIFHGMVTQNRFCLKKLFKKELQSEIKIH